MIRISVSCILVAGLLFSGSYGLAQEEESEDASPSIEANSQESQGDESHEAPSSSDDAEALPASSAADNSAQNSPLWPVRIGASISAGVPQPFSYGLELTFLDVLSFSFHTGKFESTVDDVDIQLASWDLRARWHVFAGSFYLGVGYGHHGILAYTEQDVGLTIQGLSVEVPTAMQGEVTANHITPMLGWQATWDMGLIIGFDMGVHIPIGPKNSFDVVVKGATEQQEEAVKSTKDYKDAETHVKDLLELIGETPLPVLALRVGWVI